MKGWLVLLLVASGAHAQATFADLDALKHEQQHAWEDWQNRPPEAGSKVARTPDDGAYAARAIAVAKRAPKTQVARDALIWASQVGVFGEQLPEALQLLARDHHEDPLAMSAFFVVEQQPRAGIQPLVEQTLDGTQNPGARRVLNYALGWLEMDLGDREDAVDREKHYTQAQQYLERAAAGQPASAALSVRVATARRRLDHQVIGRPADEIEGIDSDGHPMKLSELRGKVVVLDFWGDW